MTTRSRGPWGRAWLPLLAALLLAGCGDGPPGDEGGSAGAGGTDSGEINGDVGGETDASAGDDAVTAGDTETGDTGSVALDGGGTDSAGGDVGGDAGVDVGGDNCPGGESCPCVENKDCDNGICLDTSKGKVCAKKCIDNCPTGFTCKSYGSSDAVFVCVEDHISICAPCEANSDCNAINAGTLCLDYGDAGKFCGGACKADADCPADYGCVDTPDKDTGAIVKQCRLKAVAKGGSGGACSDDGQCPKGEVCNGGKCAVMETPVCGCSKWATVFATTTTCKNTNDVGVCSGKRTCTDKGMSPCSAPTPVEETCNAVDDDCDGATDVLPAAVTCTVATYIDEGTKTKCGSDADCTSQGEGCDPVDGLCKTLVGACPGKATCGAKGELLCVDAKKAAVESCNGVDDNCDGKVDEAFTWTEPGGTTPKGIGASCGQGLCAGGKVGCETLLKASCTTADKAGKEQCDGKDNDCDGQTDDGACEDGDECTLDQCDAASGKCTNPPGATCDDNNPCTTDSCNTATGKCEAKFYAGSCDDGDACTVGDTCKDGAVPTCESGAQAKKCDDDNVCTDDSCDKAKGCVNLANAVTQSCFEGDKQLIGVGECVVGVRYCKAGKLGSECVGQVVPANNEACDAKDNDCDGNTDEGCDAAGATVGTSTVSASTGAGSKQVYLHIGGDGPSGSAKGTKSSVWSGFVAWLSGALGK